VRTGVALLPMLEGFRRGLLILVAIAVPTALISLLVGLGSDMGVRSALATGFYVVGAMLMVVGVLSGARGPLRSASQDDPAEAASLFGAGLRRRRLRKATDEERREAVFGAMLFLVIGLVLVAFGVIADSQAKLI
jgi:hypothetical protein